ncbi:MAG: isoprenylcysteine carboxylmethyltransferase family protein [Acidobacteriaceae bacterium]|jgi:protein-S-isoprenylcysteine O-methyltransferase Ste14
MPPTPAAVPVPRQSKQGASVSPRLIQGLIYMGLWIVLLFASAGTIRWPRGWICCLTYCVTMLTLGGIVHRFNPGLIAARAKWRHRDTQRFDKFLLPVYLPLLIGQPVAGGLDVMRFRWSSMPLSTLYLGLGLFFLSVSVIGWTMAVNPWAESSVRIQSDRGQQVVRAGPYRYVRHPMYFGMILMTPGVACMLGSVWVLFLAAVIALITMIRTALEDSALQRELAGYREYTKLTRWRLVPGLW